MGLLEGKRALIAGVATRRSIAWGIAQALSREGATLALTYQGERVRDRVEDCASHIPGTLLLPMDVTEDDQIANAFGTLGKQWDRLDILVHSIAYALPEDLEGRFVDTSREGFRIAIDSSAYSLVAMTRAAHPLMHAGGSVMAMTYIAGERVFPSYNVMGVAKAALESSIRYLAADLGPQNIRVNAISAGPISTPAARGIASFTQFAKMHRENAPLRRPTTADEVGDTAIYLASDLARGVTGETIFVDGGYHVLGSFT